MKPHRIYQSYKTQIKEFADNIQTTDKPMRRSELNDYYDYCQKDMANYYLLNGMISDMQYNQFCGWLVDYVIKRHEK